MDHSTDQIASEERPSRRHRMFHTFHREEGQSAFEFILLLPIFLLFVLLLIDFGILMFEYVAVSNAAREGARYGAVNCPDPVTTDCTVDLVRTRTTERSSGVVADPLEVSVTWPDGTARGAPIAVSVSHDYEFLFFPFTLPVASCAEMRLEQADFVAPTTGGLGCS